MTIPFTSFYKPFNRTIALTYSLCSVLCKCIMFTRIFFPSSILWITILYHTFCPKTWINVLNFFRTVSSSFLLQRSEGKPRGTVIGWRPLALNIANARTYFSNTSNPTVSNPTVHLFLEGHIKVGLWCHRWQFQIFVFKCRYCSW